MLMSARSERIKISEILRRDTGGAILVEPSSRIS